MKRRTHKTVVFHPCMNCTGKGYILKSQSPPAGSIPVDMAIDDYPTYQETCEKCLGSGEGQIKEIRMRYDITDLTLNEKMEG